MLTAPKPPSLTSSLNRSQSCSDRYLSPHVALSSLSPSFKRSLSPALPLSLSEIAARCDPEREREREREERERGESGGAGERERGREGEGERVGTLTRTGWVHRLSMPKRTLPSQVHEPPSSAHFFSSLMNLLP